MTEVLIPTSPEEASGLFRDDAGMTVFAGCTTLLPDIAEGRIRPDRALLLTRAGLSGVSSATGVMTIGSMTPLAAVVGGIEPLASAARGVGDGEVRAQATVGGNLCVSASAAAPRGDLQAALIALDARVVSVGADGERTDPVEVFLAAGAAGRLVTAIEIDEVPHRAGHAAMRRPHTHSYTPLAVSIVASADGDTLTNVRVAATGCAPGGVRLPAVEAALEGAIVKGLDGRAAGEAALADVDPPTDALASSWYRRRMLPIIVARAVADLIA